MKNPQQSCGFFICAHKPNSVIGKPIDDYLSGHILAYMFERHSIYKR